VVVFVANKRSLGKDYRENKMEEKQRQKTIRLIKPQNKEDAPLRVAAYCRVSSTSEDQEESYVNQVTHYTKYIGENPNWELADIYADEGISGMSTKGREDFARLIKDAQRGKMDRVLVKSVSRFARNTQECLQYARILKLNSVSVLFEKENIDTEKMNDEVLLTMFGMVAQYESQSLSGNLKWSYQRRMESGEFNTCRAPYGFNLVNGNLVINECEAETVRRIFDLYLAGVGKHKIADMLNAEGVPTKHEEAKWWSESITYILRNERYMGNALLQKRFTTDTVPPKQVKNRGEKTMYYVENSNQRIVSAETFSCVKELMEKRSASGANGGQDPIRGKIICPDCGASFRRQIQNSVDFWVCCRRVGTRYPCHKISIRDEHLKRAFLIMVNKLAENRGYILTPLISRFAQMQLRLSNTGSQVYLVDKEIADLSAQNISITRLYTRGMLGFSDYNSKKTDLEGKISMLRRKRRLLLSDDEDEETLSDLRELDEVMATADRKQRHFNDRLFSAVVEKIVPVSNEEVIFRLIGGLDLPERLTL